MEQASANLSSTMTGRSSNSSCASNLPPPAPMPAAQPVQQEPELPKTAPSVNRRKDLLFFLFPIFGSPISLSLSSVFWYFLLYFSEPRVFITALIKDPKPLYWRDAEGDELRKVSEEDE